MADYADILLNSVQTLVDKTVENLEFNKTIKAEIIDATKAIQGQYQVSTGTSVFDAYSTETYNIGDQVYVQILNNDMSSQKIIIGKVVSKDYEDFSSSKPFDAFINISKNLIDADVSAGLIANHPADNKQEIVLWTDSFSGSQVSRYSTVGIKAKFKTWLGAYNLTSGEYGLRLDIHTQDKSGLITPHSLYFSNDKMLGDTYNFSTFFDQEILFDISAYINITYMELIFYQKGGSFITENDEPIPYQEEITPGNFVDLAPNIFIKDVVCGLGLNKGDIEKGKDFIELTTQDILTYTENEVKNLELIWVHWINDEECVSMPQDDIAYNIRWYKYELNLGDEFDPYLPSKNWCLIDDNFDVFNYMFTTSPIRESEQIKAVLIAQQVGAPDQVYTTNTVIFNNTHVVPQQTDSKSGLTLTITDGTDGNYFIYGPGNKILNNLESKQERTIKASFVQANDKSIDLLADENGMYDISWEWEQSESAMFFSTESPQGSMMFKYKIKDYYPSNSPLNTITCTITDKERNLIYTKSINLNFGTAGTSGTDGTLVIDFEGDQKVVEYGDTSAKFIVKLFDAQNRQVDLSDSDKYKLTWNVEYSEQNAGPVTIDNTGLLSCSTGITFSHNIIVEACVEGFGDYPLKVKKPISITRDASNLYILGGITEVIYSTVGEPVSYSIPYQIYDRNLQPVNEYQGHKITWHINIAEQNEAGAEKYVATISDNNILQPPVMYVENAPLYSVCGVYNDDIIAIICPILVTKNAYPSTTMNKWNGKDISIDNDKGKIVAPAISAGRKEADNTFSGIMMGDWQDESFVSQTGLYGFDHGDMAYSFKQDGTAFIGKSGKGRINFDGNEGTITSGNYLTYEGKCISGSQLNLTTGDIVLGGGNLQILGSTGDLIATGNITATTLTATQKGKIGCFDITQDWLYDFIGSGESIFLGTNGVYLGTPLDESGAVSLGDSPFYVTKAGHLHATKGNIAGWNITEEFIIKNQGNEPFYLRASANSDDTWVTVAFGSNFLIGNEGTVNITNALITNNLEIKGHINGLYTIVTKTITYSISKTKYYKSFSGNIFNEKKSLKDHYKAVAFARVNSGNKYVKIVGYGVEENGQWYVRVSKHPYRNKAIKATLSISILLLKSTANSVRVLKDKVVVDDKDGLEGFEEDALGDFDTKNQIYKPTIPTLNIDGGIIEDNTNEDDGDDDTAVGGVNSDEQDNLVFAPGNQNTDISKYAPLDSPIFTGIPKVEIDEVDKNTGEKIKAIILTTSNFKNTIDGWWEDRDKNNKVATQKWVNSQGFAKETWVTNNFINKKLLNNNNALKIANGGTGATNAADARSNLNAASATALSNLKDTVDDLERRIIALGG